MQDGCVSLPPDTDDFDPYRIWLGIPRAEQPPHYYRLLGVTLFESDPQVIQEAADRQLAHLRTKQTGGRVALSQKLLQHVASAAACLLNPPSKANYDLHLRNSLVPVTGSVPPAQPVVPVALPQAVPLPVARPMPVAAAVPAPAPTPVVANEPPRVVVSKPPAKRAAHGLNPLALVAIGGGVGIGLVVLIVVMLSNSGIPGGSKPASISERNPSRESKPKPAATFSNATNTPARPLMPPVLPSNPTTTPADPFAPTTPNSPRTPAAPSTAATNPPGPDTSLLVPPPNDAGGLVAGDAAREAVEFLGKLYAQLDQEFRVPANRTYAAKHVTLMQQILAGETSLGPIPAGDAALQGYRKDVLRHLLKPLDNEFLELRGDPVLSAELLAMMTIPYRVHSPGPVGQIVRTNGLDIFPVELARFADRLHELARAGDDLNHDRLIFLAAVVRLVQFGYLRGNAEQYPSCVFLHSLGMDATADWKDAALLKQFQAAQDELFLAAGLTHSGDNIEADPRRSYRNATSQYTRQPNGDWLETSPEGVAVYREVTRTPTVIELALPDNPDKYPRVQLMLLWSTVTIRVEPNTTRLRDRYSEGVWDVPKSARSLTPRLTIRLPGTKMPPPDPKNPVAVAPQPNPQRPGSRPAAVPAPLVDKKLWRHLGGFIELDADGVWRELTPAGDYFTLTFIGPREDALEFQRGNSTARLRIFDTRCELSPSSGSPFVEAYKGNWATPLEEIELDAPQAALLKKTCDAYQDALARARKLLLDKFDGAIAAGRKRTGKAEDRLALISLLEGEQGRFEREGLIPWSTPMRTAASDYLTATQRARQLAESNFDKAIDHSLNHSQPETANSVLVLKQKTLAPLLVAKLIPRGGGAIPRDLPLDEVDRLLRERRGVVYRLWSNGQLNEAVGASKWTAESGGLVLNIVRSNSAAKDRLTLSEKGDEFTAQSTSGNTYSGAFGGTLEPHERRPVVDFEAKVKP
jgi:hypothetical protein